MPIWSKGMATWRTSKYAFSWVQSSEQELNWVKLRCNGNLNEKNITDTSFRITKEGLDKHLMNRRYKRLMHTYIFWRSYSLWWNFVDSLIVGKIQEDSPLLLSAVFLWMCFRDITTPSEVSNLAMIHRDLYLLSPPLNFSISWKSGLEWNELVSPLGCSG